jgi:hypothetical protein
MALAAALMAVAAGWAIRLVPGSLWQTVVGTAAGGITYLLASWLLRVDELAQLWGYARRRARRPA